MKSYRRAFETLPVHCLVDAPNCCIAFTCAFLAFAVSASRVVAAAIVFLSAAVSSRAAGAETTLFESSTTVSVVYAPESGIPIAKAAALLGHDLKELTGREPAVLPAFDRVEGSAVIVGRADSPMIAALLRANRISTAPLEGKWETYGRVVVPAPWNPEAKALVIFGSDTRGTIWGVIDLTRELGVSPWEWWADVSIRRLDTITVDGSLRYSTEPSVKYRGIFLNAGSNGLNPWSARTFDPQGGIFGPRTYAKIFELMWRLKANTIWPAMTSEDTPFNGNPENAKTAEDYAIVRGSSHVEMLLRNNPHEWNDKVRGQYNWLLNREEMIRYWTESVKAFGKYENFYTVGLRNKDDFPMQGADSAEKMAAVLHDAIFEQRKILSSVLNKPAREAPQVFTAYKEVLTAYDTGLIDLPDDITLTWPDDNFGYIRRLSSLAERGRSGGSGIYYHNVFWGPPMSYLWLASTHPALMWEEMTKAYHFDTRRLWILNVGSIKPGEFFTQFFLALAFDTKAFETCSSVRDYLHSWAADTFGPEFAERVTGIVWSYYQLAFERNPEFMGWNEVFPENAIQQTEFNTFAFGDENSRRVSAYEALVRLAKEVMAALPNDRKAAFFQLVQYPVNGAAALNLRQLFLDKTIAYGLQHRASANVYAEKVQEAHDRILADTRIYNEVMADGKWRGMMESAPQDLPVYERPHTPAWNDNGEKKCGVQTEGGAFFDGTGWWTPSLPDFHPELRETYFIDIFAQGAIEATWAAAATLPVDAFAQASLDLAKTTPAKWIKLSRTTGRFSPADKHFEDRIQVSIDWKSAPVGGIGDVIISGPSFKQPIAVHVRIARPYAREAASFLEANRIVSIYAVHTDSRSEGWEVLDGLGHTGVSLRTLLDMKSVDATRESAIRQAPNVVYRFATQTATDRATLRAIAIPTFPITKGNGVRIAVSVDGGTPQVLDFSAPEFSVVWRRHALSNKAVAEWIDLPLAPGAHTLSVYGLDPGVTLDRFEISFAGAPVGYGPVPETRVLPTIQ